MFGKIGDMSKMLEGMQENAQKLESELASKIFRVKSGGGLVEVVINGKGEVIDINIDNSLLNDKDSLQILLIGALNDANKMVEQNRQNSALGILGGINPFGMA
ncbi:MAG: nucleoid-associated protein, YbaB/EbfC family [Sulfurimonas sp. RIFOXYD12_FULL_33_39]|uniref:YbaB/EbfC family nucleoid-associated protein n=1 Tax=unclassified Sulfurimonas TaxID=2623549 RepID=UPI0008D6B21B|nr:MULTISPECIES: YbaB/EbfC family nucleoid-associated protein [unclassified Sulfurimonas]OHE07604.1 MAG: nucleoid-associated protein, YbaB/EbfC family [Sulfurimonas sp. RIFCSPLOWO2_12_FULL_34_6]OHE10404.1 MAG: nucleoid-associated protein, YbaB/EbfC family [Sulfurimonas sp. RIFOXYD12_FULL_33_39]OHE14861.1 MAG: nucleoid-associated protein, YbaB/EbfC family [Sulfurimonas sp. RIFOXYD2_FULL_34_21]DAB27897.1 MAG TPA: nucleoid-associated protein, YbaB/EbfC family [Sulfurimonas sp. UBA10385]